MFNYETIKSKKDFIYWFKRIGVTSEWKVMNTLESDKVVAYINEQSRTSGVTPISMDLPADEVANITMDFDEFQHSRPEYQVGRRLNKELIYKPVMNEEQLRLLKEEIDLYIIACCYDIYDKDGVAEKYAKRAIAWLESTDFYTAPASTKYHESEFGGLIRHTLKVVDKIIELRGIDTYADVNLSEAILAAICHDFCKINFYEPYQKNVKNDKTGIWEQQLAFKYKGSDIPLGHGVTSMFIASKLFKLTTEQALAIRWHMNEYNVCDAERQDLMDANEKFRMVTMLQTADRLSII